MSEFVKVCEEAARAGGAVLMDWRDRFSTRQKAPRDLVTDADLASQTVIRELLLAKFPDHEFLGEEDAAPEDVALGPAGGREGQEPFMRWVVDPLDGTTNYVHQLPMFSVSVALQSAEDIVAGAVYDPVADECFTATIGKGTRLNGQSTTTSRCEDLTAALLAASFAANVPRGSLEISRFVEVLHVCQAVRRLGSAALNLGYVAMGRLDGYWASSVKPWDVAAGVLLVREAGGIVTGLDGSPFRLENPHFVAAATPRLHEQLLETLRRVEPGTASGRPH